MSERILSGNEGRHRYHPAIAFDDDGVAALNVNVADGIFGCPYQKGFVTLHINRTTEIKHFKIGVEGSEGLVGFMV